MSMMMMGLVRLGKDMEIRTLGNGKPVGQLSLAYHYGRKDEQTGERPTQWIEAAMFGDRATAVADMLRSGMLIMVVLDEVRIETYTSKEGAPRFSMKARVVSFEFTGKNPESKSQEKRFAEMMPKPPADDFADDIPF